MAGGRTWLAVVLACLVWFGYIRWFAPPSMRNGGTPPASTTQTPGTEHATPSQSSTTSTASPAVGGKLGAAPKLESTFTKSNPDVELSFSDRGGRISRAQLLHYREGVRKDTPGITLINESNASFSLATLFSEAALQSFADGAYVRSVEGNTVHFSRTDGGVTVKKSYKVSESGYKIETDFAITFPEGRKEWGQLLIPLGGEKVEYEANVPLKHWEVVVYQNENVKRRTIDTIKAEEVLQGTTAWLAFGNRYFASVLINRAALNPDVVLTGEGAFAGAYLRYPLVLKEGERTVTVNLQSYLGPKEYDRLSQVPGLKQLIDYGMFKMFAYPLLALLNFLYQFVHNYGIAIILLTLLVRIAFYPLSVKSYKSMKAMQKLQPQLVTLKEKYKDDRERFAREQMALFKTHKVNPAGGCIPMLVQLPIFIALYAVLANSIELFHAPFFGWVQDLSAKDPFYIFPVLMGISMFFQQKMTPTAGMDPAQAKMMLFMPVVFSAMMINLPSGLTVYMFVSTLLGIAQQLSLSRDPKVEKVPTVAESSPEKG